MRRDQVHLQVIVWVQDGCHHTGRGYFHRRVAEKYRGTDERRLQLTCLVKLVVKQDEIVGWPPLHDGPALKMVQPGFCLRACVRREQRWQDHEQGHDHKGFDGLHSLTSWPEKQWLSACLSTVSVFHNSCRGKTCNQAMMSGGLRAIRTNKDWNELKNHIHPRGR